MRRLLTHQCNDSEINFQIRLLRFWEINIKFEVDFHRNWLVWFKEKIREEETKVFVLTCS